jgi:hypothetical protein
VLDGFTIEGGRADGIALGRDARQPRSRARVSTSSTARPSC